MHGNFVWFGAVKFTVYFSISFAWVQSYSSIMQDLCLGHTDSVVAGHASCFKGWDVSSLTGDQNLNPLCLAKQTLTTDSQGRP